MNQHSTIPLSFYDHVEQNQTQELIEASFLDITAILNSFAEEEFARKEDAPLITSCEFEDGRRRKANVTRSGLVILDIDQDARVEAVQDTLAELGTAGFLYTTASHTPENHKFRVGVPLAENVDAATYTRAWRALNRLVGDVADSTKRGAESLFYLPGRYPSSDSQYVVLDGEIIPAQVWIDSVGISDEETGSRTTARAPTARASARLTGLRDALHDKDRRTSIYDSNLVTERAKAKYLDAAGDWHHARYGFMCSVAARAKKLGVDLSPEELRELFNQIDLIDGGFYQTPAYQQALLGDAVRAMQFAVTGEA